VFFKKTEWFLEALGLLIFSVFFFRNLPLDVLSIYPATGGDTGSHFWPFKILFENSLPNFSIRNWNPGNLGGEPHFLMYFPLSFLVMSFLALFMPIGLAFNFGMIFPILVFPYAVYFSLKLMSHKFPIPILGAGFSVLMIYNEGQTMWGGNFLSILSGQFAHLYALIFFVLGIGFFVKEIRDNKFPFLSSVTFALTATAHAYVALAIPAITMAYVVFLNNGSFQKRLKHLFLSGFISFLLSLWFTVPLVTSSKWTTAFFAEWRSKTIFQDLIAPNFSLVFYLMCFSILLFLLLSLFNSNLFKSRKILSKDKKLWSNLFIYLFFSLSIVLMFFVFPKLGVVDIRALPQLQVSFVLFASIMFGSLLRKKRILAWLITIPFCFSCVWAADVENKKLGNWLKWNYSGWQNKAAYPELQKLSEALKGDFSQGRVVYEQSDKNRLAGTLRVFEMLPYFANRATLESVYLQASIISPMAFLIQALISVTPSCPFEQYPCPKMNIENSRDILELMGVQDLVLVSERAVNGAKKLDWLKQSGVYGFWNLFSLKNTTSLVEVLTVKPEQISLDDWKNSFFKWGKNYHKGDTYLGIETDLINNKVFELSEIDCNPKLEVDFGQIVLSTACPNKAHLLKFSFHSAWSADDESDLYLVSPGFMMIVPRNTRTVLTFGASSVWSMCSFVSFLTFFCLLIIKFYKKL